MQWRVILAGFRTPCRRLHGATVDLNKKLMSYATENVTAAVGNVKKLSQAKTLEEVVKIQTEFMARQLDSFNEQTKAIVEICTKAAQDATKRSLIGKFLL
jgi:hypothetical protein